MKKTLHILWLDMKRSLLSLRFLASVLCVPFLMLTAIWGMMEGSFVSAWYLARLSLGRDQSLVLVQAGERYLLLGAAPSGVTLTAELTPEEAKALYQPPSDQPPPPSFTEALRTVLKQKKPR